MLGPPHFWLRCQAYAIVVDVDVDVDVVDLRAHADASMPASPASNNNVPSINYPISEIKIYAIHTLLDLCYTALLPRRGPHIESHSVCLSVCLSVRPVIVAIGNVFSSTASVTDVLFGTH